MSLRYVLLNELFDVGSEDADIKDESDSFNIGLKFEGKDIEIQFSKVAEWVIDGNYVDAWELWFSIEGSFTKNADTLVDNTSALIGIVL